MIWHLLWMAFGVIIGATIVGAFVIVKDAQRVGRPPRRMSVRDKDLEWLRAVRDDRRSQYCKDAANRLIVAAGGQP